MQLINEALPMAIRHGFGRETRLLNEMRQVVLGGGGVPEGASWVQVCAEASIDEAMAISPTPNRILPVPFRVSAKNR